MANPKWVAAMHDGKMYLRERKPQFAKDAFNKANKIAGGSCWNCLQAPPFEVTALDGTHFNLDAMGGRVVLIDSGRRGASPAMKSCQT